MNSLEPLVTVHASMGAFRTVTSDLLAETYLTPRPQAVDLSSIIDDRTFPWSASMAVAPIETTAAVSSALRSLAVATQSLSPDEVNLGVLDEQSMLYKHISALCDLWRANPSVLQKDLQVYSHVLELGPVTCSSYLLW